jgi:hypothetical protein
MKEGKLYRETYSAKLFAPNAFVIFLWGRAYESPSREQSRNVSRES